MSNCATLVCHILKKPLAFTDILRGMQICVLAVCSARDFLLEPPFMLMLVLKRMCQYLECISPIIFWKMVGWGDL